MNGSLAHGIVAFFFPIAWAIILFPFLKKYHYPWRKTIIFVMAASFLSMVFKEFIDSKVSVNDIVADILGLFFGTAFLSAVFVWGGKHVSKLAVGVFQAKGNVSLRDLLTVADTLEQRAVAFFKEAAGRVFDERVKDLCTLLANEEKGQSERIEKILNHWNRKAPDKEFMSSLEEKMANQGLYTKPILTGASSRDVLEYAIEMKKLTQDLYSSFVGYFPLDWKREKLEELMKYQEEEETRLEDMLRNL